MAHLHVFTRYIDALASGDLEALAAVFTDDVVWHQPGAHRFSGTRRGTADVFSLLAAMAQHSDGSLRVDAESAMENGDLIAATVRFSASRGDARIEMSGVDLFRVSDDRIAEVWLFSSDQSAEDDFWNL
ncbi:nuclear transport factor 2 family protein [Agromyces silvae]|uniref:nuclear transport factor 2 family protein n=1 Tax=Agromyces silvae TaxID=3388266 RepID=UPI00280A9C1D|nr:nuclear transport factor 2 family protein [Agromyces protaetiae]